MAGVVRALWERWKRLASRIAYTQARVLLTFFYYAVFGPFALGVRWGSDPLAIKAGSPKGWRSRDEDGVAPAERAKRQS